MKRTRRKFTAEQKVAIIRQHLVEKIPVSDICDKERLKPTVFYRWQKQFFENGASAFASIDKKKKRTEEKEIAALKAKITKKNEVLSELMEDHIALKKSLGEF